MAAQDRDLLAGRRVPDAGGLSADAVTMRDPSGLKAADSTVALMAAQDRDLLPARGVPDAGGLVHRRCDDARPVGAEGGGSHEHSWPRRTAISLLLAASQMRAVLSIDAVTMRDPSGLKAAEFTTSSWPRRTAISLPLAASQMRAVLSDDAVTMRDPSGLKAAETHGVLMAAQDRDLLGARGVPDAGGLVP